MLLTLYCGFEALLDYYWSQSDEEVFAHVIGKMLWIALILGTFAKVKIAHKSLAFLCVVNVVVAVLEIIAPTSGQRPSMVLIVLLINATIKGCVFLYFGFAEAWFERRYAENVASIESVS
jgi:hypothetical protein